MSNKHQFTTPVGRLVGGSLYEPKTTDYDGNPLVVKSEGPNKGQPRKEFGFAVAVKKSPGATHWAQEAWLKPLWDLAHAAFPNGDPQRPDFAWKITDGDSAVPRKGKNGQPGRKPCEQEGYPGHWVLWFSGGQAPRIYNADGSQQIVELGAVKRGYYVQVFGDAVDNKPSASPGLYLNHKMVALSAYGEEITSGPDVSQAGFGQGVQLPAGASATPVSGAFNPAPAVPGAGAPPVPGAGAPAVPGAGAPPVPGAGAPAVPGAAVAPNPAFAAVPGGVPAVPTPPAAVLAPPPAAPVRVMLPAAAGATYEQLLAAGWNDALLVQHGMMAA